jgi:hypothetical protein
MPSVPFCLMTTKKGAFSSPCLIQGTGKHHQRNTKAGGAPSGAPPGISLHHLKKLAGFRKKL